MKIIKKKNFEIFLIFLLPIISWMLLSQTFVENNKKFDELALGKDNKIIINKILDQNILCSSAENIEDCIQFLSKKNFKKKILWLGNSQLNGVNQAEIDSKIAPYRVSEYFLKKNIGLITFAAPNMSFQEYLIVFNYLVEKIEFDVVLLSLVFDDTRENGIRKNLVIKEEDRREVAHKWLRDQGLGDIIKNKKSFQELSEEKIIFFLDEKISWSLVRSQAHGSIYEFLYRLRNSIFNIKPTSIRKLVKPVYDRNLEAINKILEKTKSSQIKSVLYIAPIRNDIVLPYNIEEYSEFKNTLKINAQQFSSSFYNLEDIVPAPLWGEKSGTKLGVFTEVDFMHFKEEGHLILAKKIISILENTVK